MHVLGPETRDATTEVRLKLLTQAGGFLGFLLFTNLWWEFVVIAVGLAT